MPKEIPEKEFSDIEAFVAGHPEGVGIKVIAAAFPGMALRGLQRRLSTLAEAGRIRSSGTTRATIYRPPTLIVAAIATSQGSGPSQAIAEVRLPLSRDGETVLQLVSQPIPQRTPVGYRREFLDAYRPNETEYLSSTLRARLLAAGSTSTEREPVAGTYARKIMERLLVDLSWNSSRLEGNTYSLLETKLLLEKGERAIGKDNAETQMLLNHKAAIEFLVESADEIEFRRSIILNLHALLSDNLLPDPDACGRLRAMPVEIGQSVYHPLAVPQLIDECFQQILDTANAIKDPFEQAFFVMVQLPYLQPFDDVNKRVSRLAANIPLVKANLCPLSFTDVPQDIYLRGQLAVYELNRIELLRDVFVWAYERSAARYAAVRQSLGEPNNFKLKYRQALIDVVSDLVRARTPQIAIGKKIADWLSQNSQVPEEDHKQFREVVEQELIGMHEGNFSRHRLRESEFLQWKREWQK